MDMADMAGATTGESKPGTMTTDHFPGSYENATRLLGAPFNTTGIVILGEKNKTTIAGI